MLMSTIVFGQYAINVPEGYEIVSQTEDRIEVRDLETGFITPYYVGNLYDSTITNNEFDAKENGIHEWFYFERVAELPWYVDMQVIDANHNGLSEIYATVDAMLYREVFLYPWVFEHYEYNTVGLIYDVGDQDGDSLTDIFIGNYEGEAIMESNSYDSYPDTIVWTYFRETGQYLINKFGDLDCDGFGEALFYTLDRTGYQMFENIGDNQYELKTIIRFWDYVNDCTGEPSWGDIDGDGWNEVFAGGIHGEIIMFECVEDDSFEFIWEGYALTYNAYSTEFLGDTDGDGKNEFMVGAKGPFINTIWEAVGDNSYELKFTNIQDGYFWNNSSIEPADYDGDGNVEIAICTGDYLSIIKNFGDDDWRRALHFYTNSGVSIIRHFQPDTVLNPVLLNNIRTPEWTTWIYNVKGTFIPGDVNDNGILTGSDVLYLVNVLRNGVLEISEPYWRADANGDCLVDWADVTYLVNYFKGLVEIPEPGWCYFYVEE